MDNENKIEDEAAAAQPGAPVKDIADPLAAANAEIARLTAELADARASLAAQKGATTKAKNALAVMAVEQGKTRKLAPMKEQAEGLELLAAIGAAETVHLAFSDGKKEVAGIAPRAIVGAAWRLHAGRVKLEVPSLMVHGPAPGKPAFNLGGYALLLDGKQVAFSRRDQLSIGAGSQVELKDDVIF